MAVLPFLLCTVAIRSVADDDLLLTPVAVVAGTFAVQTHVGYLPLVGGFAVLAVITVVLRRVLSTSTTRQTLPLRPLITSAVLFVVMWTPPFIDELWGSGNLSKLGSYIRSPGEQPVGSAFAFGMMNAQLRLLPPWMGAPEHAAMGFSITSGWFWGVGTTVLLAAGGLGAYRRRRSDVVLLNGVALTGLALGFVATARVTGIPAPYITRWWWVLSFLARTRGLRGVVTSRRRDR